MGRGSDWGTEVKQILSVILFLWKQNLGVLPPPPPQTYHPIFCETLHRKKNGPPGIPSPFFKGAKTKMLILIKDFVKQMWVVISQCICDTLFFILNTYIKCMYFSWWRSDCTVGSIFVKYFCMTYISVYVLSWRSGRSSCWVYCYDHHRQLIGGLDNCRVRWRPSHL